MPLPLHIGIVGCSAEGAALCYRTICAKGAQLLGPHAHPEITMHTHSLAGYVEFIERNDWEGVAQLMLDSANNLKHAGADFLICPDNTIHQAMHLVEPRSRLPWLHIAEVVADEAKPGAFGYALARRERGVSREAESPGSPVPVPDGRRTQRDQPYHHG